MNRIFAGPSEVKRRTLVIVRLHPSVAALDLDQPFDQMQAHSRPTSVFTALQGLKHSKDSFLGTLWDSWSVVANREVIRVTGGFRGDNHLAAAGRVLDGVSEKVTEDLFQWPSSG